MSVCDPRFRPAVMPESFHGILTVSPQMRTLFEKIRRAGRSSATVLVRGETGTGKELVARALHACSPRRDEPFRAVNCATFTPELLASELFGHVRGAFTGAVRDKAGLFEQADNGTLFLDELAEMPIELQARLLRVLQEKRFTPVGGTQEVSADVRLVSATNAGLRELVSEGRFREDLMYRVRVVVLYLPPLRDRQGDLQALTWHFIDQFNATGLRRIDEIDPEAWKAMCTYDWPGNVRELHNNIEQAFVLGDGPVLTREELSRELQEVDHPIAEVTVETVERPPALAAPAEPPPPDLTLDEIRRQQLVDAIRRTGGRRDQMVELLGISRSTLYRRLKEHGLT